LVALILETLGNKNLGQGVLDFFMADFLALKIPVVEGKDLETAYQKIKRRPIFDVRTEYGFKVSPGGLAKIQPLMDRKELDDIVFDALCLTRGEREAVYEGVIEQVSERLKKASSLDPKDRRNRQEGTDD
jgi:hypothetical protein